MKVWIYVAPGAAVKAGKSACGLTSIDITETDIASLSSEEREELARTPSLGDAHPPQDATGIVGRTWTNSGGWESDSELEEATFDTLHATLRKRVDKRRAAAQCAEEQRRKQVLNAIHATMTWIESDGREGYPAIKRGWDDKPEIICSGSAPRLRPDENESCEQLLKTVLDIQDRTARATAEADKAILLAEIRRLDSIGSIDDLRDRIPGMTSTIYAITDDNTRRSCDEHAARVVERRRHRGEQLASAYRSGICEWGNPSQVERFHAGVLSEDEGWRIIRDHCFSALDAEHKRYTQMSWSDVEGATQKSDVAFSAGVLTVMTDSGYEAFKRISELAPVGASVIARWHRASCDLESCDSYEWRYSAKVSVNFHGRILTREYAMPNDSDPGTAEHYEDES